MSDESIKTLDKIVDTFCLTLSGIAVNLTRQPGAAMTEIELSMIKPAAQATLIDMSAEMRDRIGKVANPIMFVTGIGLYMIRVSQLMPRRGRPAPAAAPQPAPQPAPAAAPQPAPAEQAPQADQNGKDDPGYPNRSILRSLGATI